MLYKSVDFINPDEFLEIKKTSSPKGLEVSMVTWPARLDTECCYLSTEVLPIYLLAFACFRTARLAGAGTSNGSPLRRVDFILWQLVFWPCSTEVSAVLPTVPWHPSWQSRTTPKTLQGGGYIFWNMWSHIHYNVNSGKDLVRPLYLSALSLPASDLLTD